MQSRESGRRPTMGLAGTAGACLILLQACGGGGGDAGTPAVPPPSTLTVSGTAASGAALVNAGVDVRCATGTGSTTTASDGTYSVTIASGALPCVVRATSGATVLHSVAVGSGGAARANVTPVTELVVARLTGGLPSAFYAAFGAGSAAALSTAAVNGSAAAVVASLEANGLSLAGVGDTVAGPLTAANGTTPGDVYDRALDSLHTAQVNAGTSFASLVQAVALASPSAPVASLTATAALPVERLLARAATNCAAFRSGRYRLVVGQVATPPANALVVFDAMQLSLRDAAAPTPAFLTPAGPCVYQSPSGGELAVSRSGVLIGRASGPDLQLHSTIAFPEQSHAVAELAGTWNYVTLERTTVGGTPHLTAGTFTFNGQGQTTAQDFCDDMKTCAAIPTAQLPALQISANSGGGFDVANATSGTTDRLFAYRAGGGEMMLVQVAASGRVVYYTRKAPATLPPVGRTQELMNAFVSSLYTVPAALSLSKNTVTSVDPATGRFLRNAVQDFNTGATRPESLVVNAPREGYVTRTSGVVTHTDGSVSTVAEFVSLSLRGMDVGVLGLTSSNQLGISAPIVSSTP